MMENKKYRYFYYSDEQIQEKNEILGRKDKKFKTGYVTINGIRKKITQITSNKESMNRYIDAVLVAEGYESDFVYVKPESIMKKGL
jgi:hypothetical protein